MMEELTKKEIFLASQMIAFIFGLFLGGLILLIKDGYSPEALYLTILGGVGTLIMILMLLNFFKKDNNFF